MDRFIDSFLSEVSPDKALQHRLRAEIILGRSLLAKHQAGQHDQESHGSWATGILNLDTIPENLVGANDSLVQLTSGKIEDRWQFIYDTIENQIPNAMAFTKPWAESFEAVEEFRNDATRALANGEPIARDTLAGLELVNASPRTTKELYRGASFTKEELSEFKEGKSFNLPFASFAENESTANRFAINRLGGRNQLVQFVLKSGAKAIPMSYLSDSALSDELVTSGNFKIVKIGKKDLGPDQSGLGGRTTNIATLITLEHIGTFDTKELKFR